jgi:hypothetical protein
MQKYVRMWDGFIWFRTGTSGGFCGYGNELAGSLKVGNLLTR